MAETKIQGANTSVIADVNTKQQLLTRAIAVSQIHEASLLGKAFVWTAITADIDAGDTALLVANKSASENLVIEAILVRCDVEGQAKIHCPAVATWAGTTVVGMNLNRNFANNANAVAYADESAESHIEHSIHFV